MATNTEAEAVKAKRATARKNASTTPVGATPPVIGQDQPARREKLLLHPDEPRIVAEATGSLYGTQAGEEIPGFTIAPKDAFETFTPDRCTTPVTRMRWTKGQHVPTEVFEAHMAAQRQEEPAQPEETTA
jgi:hypothetical protein